MLCSVEVDYVDRHGKKKKKWVCISCSFEESILPEDKKPLVGEMAKELRGWGFDNLTSLKANEIEQAWEDHSLHRGLKEACGKIKCPVFPSSCITSGKEWKSIAKVSFERGGLFIHDIEDKYIPGVLELLAAFVDCHSSGKSGIDCPQWMKDKGILDVIPSMFVKLAGMIRKGTGYWLLR